MLVMPHRVRPGECWVAPSFEPAPLSLLGWELRRRRLGLWQPRRTLVRRPSLLRSKTLTYLRPLLALSSPHHTQIYPHPGWHEQRLEDLIGTVHTCLEGIDKGESGVVRPPKAFSVSGSPQFQAGLGAGRTDTNCVVTCILSRPSFLNNQLTPITAFAEKKLNKSDIKGIGECSKPAGVAALWRRLVLLLPGLTATTLTLRPTHTTTVSPRSCPQVSPTSVRPPVSGRRAPARDSTMVSCGTSDHRTAVLPPMRTSGAPN